jgi:hypothetical protein
VSEKRGTSIRGYGPTQGPKATRELDGTQRKQRGPSGSHRSMVEAVKKGSNVGDVSVHKRKVRCTQIGGLERKEHSEGHLTHHDEDVQRRGGSGEHGLGKRSETWVT